MNKNTVKLRWKAWYGDEEIKLTFPGTYNVTVRAMEDAPDIGIEGIKKAFHSSAGTKSIAELAKGKKTAAIALDDLTRPTQAYRILPILIDELNKGGIDESNIRIILALGTHRPMTRQDFLKKLGEKIIRSVMVLNHHPYENLVDLGRSSRRTPIKINKYFMQADLKIGLGCIIPHSSAGFSGGGKIIVPGISGMETIEANHRPTLIEIDGKTTGQLLSIESNEFRADIEEIAKMVGLDIVINVVVNSIRGIAGIYAGDSVEAHRQGVKLAKKVYSTNVPSNMDVGVFNAYPKDTDFMQTVNALNVYGDPNRRIVRENGTIVLIAASVEGRGFHSLGDKGMRLYVPFGEDPVYGKIIKGKNLIVFSPNVNLKDVHSFYPSSALLLHRWEDVVRELEKSCGKKSNVVVFPCSSIQIPKI